MSWSRPACQEFFLSDPRLIIVLVILCFLPCYLGENSDVLSSIHPVEQGSTQSQVLALLSPKPSSQCPARLCEEAEKQIYEMNANLRSYLVPLLLTLYFKYVKLDLSRPCPFWQSAPICEQNQCSLECPSEGLEANPNGVLSSWKNTSALGRITFPSRQSTIFSSWRDNPLDFALLENEALSSQLNA
jgi:hypothetical protein